LSTWGRGLKVSVRPDLDDVAKGNPRSSWRASWGVERGTDPLKGQGIGVIVNTMAPISQEPLAKPSEITQGMLARLHQLEKC